MLNMISRHLRIFLISKRNGTVHLQFGLYHCSRECQDEVLPFEWYEKAFPTVTRLTHDLKDVDLINGKLLNINDDSIIIDDRISQKMHTLKSIVRVFVGSPFLQKSLRNSMKTVSGNAKSYDCFRKISEREPMIVNSLTKVSDFLNVSAQQRKLVRQTICPQVTQHQIWTGALKKILNGLKSEMDALYESSGIGSNIGQQIVSSCLRLLTDNYVSDHENTSWMQLRPHKSIESSGLSSWQDVLEMFNDLIRYLENEKGSLPLVAKLEVMKEGLYQIRDILVDKCIGYREVQYQESLVRKKLSKTLGHPSRCLFTLLLYYLFRHVRDIEVDLRGGIYGSDGESTFRLCMGRILTSDDEKMVGSGVKQLDRALRLFKFIWETAQMKGVLELQGHLFCVGAKNRTLTYRGTLFFLHGINL